ncbi:uncharacterized protein KRP23_2702 [Phytophthora ramorum]|uniref:uncharacterized protein n=1 Tax=Phytophthora ramorum TaxID=164328 RepID=UPI0030AD5825|nr:hypothetical protein KRP23_2702 [Phytophthora ramorum]
MSMQKPASEQTAMQPTQASAQATVTTNEVSRDTSTSEPKGPPVKVSVLERFLSVRGRRSGSKTSIPTKLTAESLSSAYTKRRHDEKAVAQRAAMREPDDIFSESMDAYVPKKREQELVNLHQDEMEVSEVFLAETRALSFEREVLDKVVCDREENREVFEERLWCLLVNDRGLHLVEDDGDQQEPVGEEVASEEQVEQ